MGRSSLTGLCGRVWTSIFKDGPSSIFVQKGKGTVERYLSRDLTFALIQIFSLLAPLIIFSSLHFWYPFFFPPTYSFISCKFLLVDPLIISSYVR